MKLDELLPILESVAPLKLAESWDNVGLLVGDPLAEVTKALLTIDYTAEVAEEAAAAGVELVIAYHPPIFDPIRRLTPPSVVFDAIRRGMAIYSPHTALDVVDGGTNDVLGDVLGLQGRRALRRIVPGAWHYKVVCFVPEPQVEAVAEAMFDAGAGWIGRYSHCSFRHSGTGTFQGHEGANPTVGEVGRLEYVPEMRLETIVPADHLSEVIAAMKEAHPYEEPAFDIVQLTQPPEGKGLGRIGQVEPISRRRLIEQIKDKLSLTHVLVAGPMEGEVRVAACCAGSCGSLVKDAVSQKADLLLTGELKHHEALKAAAGGMTVVCTLHSNSERLTLMHLSARLASLAPSVRFVVSENDRDPFVAI